MYLLRFLASNNHFPNNELVTNVSLVFKQKKPQIYTSGLQRDWLSETLSDPGVSVTF
jgi:hypothetical protein